MLVEGLQSECEVMAEMIDKEAPALSVVMPRSKYVLSDEECTLFLSCFDELNPESAELVLSHSSEGVYYIDHVMSAEECERLCNAIDGHEHLSFWCNGKEDDPNTRSYRNVQTIELHSTEFANLLWQRIAHLWGPMRSVVISSDEDDQNYEREMVGTWVPCGLNPDSLFARYPSHGSFAPHTDGRAIVDFNHRSLYSVVLYLNTVPIQEGAGTRFYDESAVDNLQRRISGENSIWTANESLVESEVQAVAGRMCIFHQSKVHEGVPPIAPNMKYIIRSDVIFERTPKICCGENDAQAYELFRKGEDMVEAGDVAGAIVLFKKALKLSPEMARIMGQA